MGADHPVSWCKDYQGGRSFYTGARQHRRRRSTRRLDDAPQGRDQLGRGHERPGLQRLRRDRARELPAGQGHARRRTCSEPIGFDQLPDGRIIQTDRRGTRAPARPGRRARRRHRRLRRPSLPTTLRVYTNSEDGLYGPAVDNNFATNQWVYLYYAPQTVTNVKLSDGYDRHADDAEHDRAERRAASLTRVGSVRRLLPALALQVRRRRPSGPRTWTSAPSSRSCGSPTTAGVLPRRGRHRLRQAQQPVDGHR